MFNINLENENTVSFLINLISGFTQVLIVFFLNKLRKYVARKVTSYGTKGILFNRQYLIISQLLVIIFIASATLLIFFDDLNKSGIITLCLLSTFLMLSLLFREIIMFWNVGLSHITSKIAKDTYRRAFNSTNHSFYLLGTNAFSFSNLPEFEQMLKRIRQCRGDVKILVADPQSNGLTEAARIRNCMDDLYQNQGKRSIGQLLDLKYKYGIKMEIRVYNAKNVEELPIFRSMFLDRRYCISSIAVYGREDHGRNFPQIFSKSSSNRNSAPKSMYNLVYRYFLGEWDAAYFLSTEKEIEYLEYWKIGIEILKTEKE